MPETSERTVTVQLTPAQAVALATAAAEGLLQASRRAVRTPEAFTSATAAQIATADDAMTALTDALGEADRLRHDALMATCAGIGQRIVDNFTVAAQLSPVLAVALGDRL